MTSRPRSRSRWVRSALVLILGAAFGQEASAQLGKLVSPGVLSKAHSKYEDLAHCQKCHEQGKQVSATRCLECHKPVAERIAQKKGVHRAAGSDCVKCHIEHGGLDTDLRHFDEKKFDHAREAGYPLDGKHAPIAAQCAKCHKTRSYLTLKPDCASCHQDPHKGKLGPACATCHAVSVAFKDTVKLFDHSKAAFQLDGAHRTVLCEKCHAGKVWKGLKFQLCTDCHKNPHKESMGTDCKACHAAIVPGWKVERFDHTRSGTPLVGKHAAVACAKCHVKPSTLVRLRPSPCAACHQDPHKGNFQKDCAACHKETGWKGAPFDHAAKTKFPLEGKHATLACAACHKTARVDTIASHEARPAPRNGKANGNGLPAGVDFRGLKTECAACHADPHKGQLGRVCEKCHNASFFKVQTFAHPRLPEFFAGQHANVACEKCHRNGANGHGAAPGEKLLPAATRIYKDLPTDCATCHKDAHLGQVGQKCESCHAVAAAKFAAPLFRHDQSAFKLTGKHQTTDCQKCHKKESALFPAGQGTAVRYRGVQTACASCHKDVHLGQVGAKCESCHTTADFAVKSFVHKKPAGFFRGKHATVPCANCHKKVEADFPAGRGTTVKLTGLGTCTACHKDVHSGKLGAACASCHDPADPFVTASRAFHKVNLFPLEGKHLGVPCESCHVRGVVKGTPNRCYDCHWIRRQDDKYRTRLGNQCEDCHRPTSWTAVQWDHSARTGFPLSSVHRTLACDQCHKGQVFQGTPASCVSCHMKDYTASRNPNHAAGGFPTTCQTCHRPADVSWHQARFDHSTFVLAGIHATTTCASCHKNDVYRGTPRTCTGCHKADYDASRNPPHAASGISTSCDSCHRFADASWSQARYVHTSLVLAGAHSAQPCSACHKNGVYKGTSRICAGCHQADYAASKVPPHISSGFPTTCDTCHKFSDPTWHLATFDHSTFPNAGVHATIACTDCHVGGIYKGTSRACIGCHQKDYDGSRNPPHAASGFATTCESCHRFTDMTWHEGKFAHTGFPLAGIHASQACAACHTNGIYKGTSRLCSGCHLPLYTATKILPHAANGIPTTCDSCHKFTDPDWLQAKYTHVAFQLVGVHATRTCTDCHVGSLVKGTSTLCSGCHLPLYTATKSPAHAAAGFPTTCDSCHKNTDTLWTQGVFSHATFPLAGVHATRACADCHVNSIYKGTSRLCSGCHLPLYTATKIPPHAANGIPTTCDSCHKFTDPDWLQPKYTHKAFALVGVHTTRACADCHKGGVWAGTSTLCSGCHLPLYTATKTPPHAASGFPTTCDSCHKNTDPNWLVATFTHSTFPLSGVHATRACADCHVNSIYKGTSRLCSGCHLPLYNATTNPKHSTAGFPTTCDSCHKFTDTLWTQGVFAHTKFPITSGNHKGRACSACHVSPSSYLVFSCLTSCHAKATTDSHHSGRSGYAYDSNACYSCHPQGRAG